MFNNGMNGFGNRNIAGIPNRPNNIGGINKTPTNIIKKIILFFFIYYTSQVIITTKNTICK